MENTLKIFVQDPAWRGCIVVVAYSEEEARVLMAKEFNYSYEKSVQEMDIVPGLVICNVGDM